MSRHYVITISRQFGTGGREIGKALGAALGVPVYDRELLEEAARTYCIPVSVMERNDETAPSRVLESFALSAPSLSMPTGAVDYSTIVTSDTTFAWQSATIRRLSKEGPCVIIGRCADHVLRGTPGVVSLFLYADYEARVDHITQQYQLSRGDATILIDETEKACPLLQAPHRAGIRPHGKLRPLPEHSQRQPRNGDSAAESLCRKSGKLTSFVIFFSLLILPR